MPKTPHFAPIFASVALFFVIPVSAGTGVSLGEIKKSLICLCECNMTVEACEGSMACESSEKLTDEARVLVDRGVNKKQVLRSFVMRYGERILAAPTKKGFNLTAWLLPFAAIVAAGLGIVSALRRWVNRRFSMRPEATGNDARSNDSPYGERLEEVLKSLD